MPRVLLCSWSVCNWSSCAVTGRVSCSCCSPRWLPSAPGSGRGTWHFRPSRCVARRCSRGLGVPSAVTASNTPGSWSSRQVTLRDGSPCHSCTTWLWVLSCLRSRLSMAVVPWRRPRGASGASTTCPRASAPGGSLAPCRTPSSTA
uniref:Putative hcg2042888 isoform cra a n=1 Tax=Ixodes ricinus TaxID=34613 RepID=A0A147BD35_IXORI